MTAINPLIVIQIMNWQGVTNMDELMTITDYEWLEELEADLERAIKNFKLFFEMLSVVPDPKIDFDYFEIPTYMRKGIRI